LNTQTNMRAEFSNCDEGEFGSGARCAHTNVDAHAIEERSVGFMSRGDRLDVGENGNYWTKRETSEQGGGRVAFSLSNSAMCASTASEAMSLTAPTASSQLGSGTERRGPVTNTQVTETFAGTTWETDRPLPRGDLKRASHYTPRERTRQYNLS
jgi:hypothetical protein